MKQPWESLTCYSFMNFPQKTTTSKESMHGIRSGSVYLVTPRMVWKTRWWESFPDTLYYYCTYLPTYQVGICVYSFGRAPGNVLLAWNFHWFQVAVRNCTRAWIVMQRKHDFRLQDQFFKVTCLFLMPFQLLCLFDGGKAHDPLAPMFCRLSLICLGMVRSLQQLVREKSFPTRHDREVWVFWCWGTDDLLLGKVPTWTNMV